jgi:hypothetical protein
MRLRGLAVTFSAASMAWHQCIAVAVLLRLLRYLHEFRGGFLRRAREKVNGDATKSKIRTAALYAASAGFPTFPQTTLWISPHPRPIPIGCSTRDLSLLILGGNRQAAIGGFRLADKIE